MKNTTLRSRAILACAMMAITFGFQSSTNAQRTSLQDILDRVTDLEADRDALLMQVTDLETKLANVSVVQGLSLIHI